MNVDTRKWKSMNDLSELKKLGQVVKKLRKQAASRAERERVRSLERRCPNPRAPHPTPILRDGFNSGEENDEHDDDGAVDDTQQTEKKPFGPRHTFHCVGCGTYAFRSIRVFRLTRKGQQRVVLDPDIYNRVKVWDYPDEGDGNIMRIAGEEWLRLHKISCTICGHQWGNASRSPEGEMLIFAKLSCFVLKSPQGEDVGSYTAWYQAPITWPVLRLDEKEKYVDKTRDLVFLSAYDFKLPVGSKGGLIKYKNDDICIEVAKRAVLKGKEYLIQADTTAHVSYLYEDVKGRYTVERLVTPSVQFASADTDEALPTFGKAICVKLKHNAVATDNVKVYKSLHREANFFDEIQHKSTRQQTTDTADYYTIDHTTIHIYTRELACFSCTEVEPKPVDCTVLNVLMFARVRANNVHVLVYGYSKLEVHTRYVTNLRKLMKRSEYAFFRKEDIQCSKYIACDDVFTVTAVYTAKRNETWRHATKQPQTQKVSANHILRLEDKVPCLKVAIPQKMASFKIKPKDVAQRMVGVRLIFCQHKDGRYESLSLKALSERDIQKQASTKQTMDIQISLRQNNLK